ncbi:MAG: uroporphyrinogen decarboxylase [Hyphomicrobiaceae bacterium]
MPNPSSEIPTPESSPFLAALAGKSQTVPPIWLMRQAGRYLPEYRKIREQANGFLNLCYSPELATEVTLQPIRRFDFDAAILFSDILIVPHALGQDVWFVEGEGPRLTPIHSVQELEKLSADRAIEKFDIVYQAVSRIRAELAPHKALIGFCGAPWTVATYMVAGRGTPDQAPARLLAYKDPAAFTRLIDLLAVVSADYLSGQIRAGVNAVQIFDSWAGTLADDQFQKWVVQPTKKLVSLLRQQHPNIPIIGFPRGANLGSLPFMEATGVNAISCDTAMPLSFMAGPLAATGKTVQGNLDPLLLVAGGQQIEDRVNEILTALRGKPFIFNLGHGIVPATPPDHVAALVEHVRNFKG